MSYVIVVLMGGAVVKYEKGSLWRTDERWLEILGTSRTPIAAFPLHRVSRVYYSLEGRGPGDGVEEAVGL